jgi:hypothetical protein
MSDSLESHRLGVAPPCPQCGAKLDAYSGEIGTHAKAGDLSVCGYCATLLQFTDDAGHVARLTPAEFAALPRAIRSKLLHLMDVVRRIQHELRKARRA